MIKLSKDNLIVYSRFFPAMVFLVHPFIIFVLININFWPIYIAYVLILTVQLVVGKIWRFFWFKDLYLSKDGKHIVFQDLNGKQTEFEMGQIAGIKTRRAISRLTILNSGKLENWYFYVNSKDNLKLFTPN